MHDNTAGLRGLRISDLHFQELVSALNENCAFRRSAHVKRQGIQGCHWQAKKLRTALQQPLSWSLASVQWRAPERAEQAEEGESREGGEEEGQEADGYNEQVEQAARIGLEFSVRARRRLARSDLADQRPPFATFLL